jgi:putative oxidoreductase
MRIALLVEFITSALLLLDIYTQYVALIGAAMLGVAAVTVFFANNKQWVWLWPKGGKEYAVFWALCLIAVSLLHWH